MFRARAILRVALGYMGIARDIRKRLRKVDGEFTTTQMTLHRRYEAQTYALCHLI